MKKTILIIILTLSIFVCKAQSEDPICRQAFENAKKVYLEKGRDEGKKSFDLLFDCGDDKISAEAIEWLKNQEKVNENHTNIKSHLQNIDTINKVENNLNHKRIGEEKGQKKYPPHPIKKSTFWDDVTDYFVDSFEGLAYSDNINQLYYSYSDIYPIIFSYNRMTEDFSEYISFGGELGFDIKSENIKGLDYDPSVYFMGNIGFNTRFFSLYLGIGPAYFWGKGSFGLSITQSTTITQGGDVISSQSINDSQYQLGHSLFVLKPSVSINIPLGYENSIHLNCGYFIFPSKSQLNCFSLGIGFSFE